MVRAQDLGGLGMWGSRRVCSPHYALSLCSWSSQALLPSAVTVHGYLLSRLLGPEFPSSPRGEVVGTWRYGRQEWCVSFGSLMWCRESEKIGVWWQEQRGLTGPWSPPGARYHALLIPSCPGALVDLASSGSLARILQHFRLESSR